MNGMTNSELFVSDVSDVCKASFSISNLKISRAEGRQGYIFKQTGKPTGRKEQNADGGKSAGTTLLHFSHFFL